MSNDNIISFLANAYSRWSASYWPGIAKITLLYLLGAGCAIGHHIFYAHLDNTSTTNVNHQRWVTRIGTGLAFLFKASLAASMGTARQQILWKTGIKKKLDPNTTDKMFEAASNPFSLLSWKMLCNAKLATFMAVLVLILPLSAIATPGTIVVVAINHSQDVPCLARTILFDFDTKSTARKLNGTNPNVTSFELADYFGATYQQPSMMARQIFTVSSFSNRIAIPTNTGLESTTGNSAQSPKSRTDTNISQACAGNCSYSVTFLGPTIKCTELPSNQEVAWASQYVNKTVFDAGVWNNNTLWIRYVASTTVNWTDPTAVAQLPQNVCSCVNSIARYTVGLEVLGGQFQEPTIRDVEILNSTLSADDLATKTYVPNRVLFDILFSILGGNVVEASKTISSPGPTSTVDRGGYYFRRAVGNAHSLAAAYAQTSSSYVVYGPPQLTYEHGKSVNQTQVGATPLASASYEIVSNISSAIETMAQKMVVSLLAADSSGINASHPLMEYAALANTMCTSTTQINVYKYSATLLIESYTPAVAVALLMALIGIWTILGKEKAHDAKFSTIVKNGKEACKDGDLVRG